MTYPRPFLRLVASGVTHTNEGWSFGLSLIAPPGNEAAPDEVPAAVVTAVQTYFTSIVTPAADLRMIKLNQIGPDGRYARATTVLHEFDTPVKRASGTSPFPPQVALAITLETSARRGRAARGRYFLPSPWAEGGVGTDGRLTAATRDAHRDIALTFIESLNAAIPDQRVGVVSDIGAGAMRPVRLVRVGRVLDTMRSRRTSLDEDYSESPEVAGYADFGGDGGTF